MRILWPQVATPLNHAPSASSLRTVARGSGPPCHRLRKQSRSLSAHSLLTVGSYLPGCCWPSVPALLPCSLFVSRLTIGRRYPARLGHCTLCCCRLADGIPNLIPYEETTMHTTRMAALCGLTLMLATGPTRADSPADSTAQLRSEVRELRAQLTQQRTLLEERVRQLEARLEQLAEGTTPSPVATATGVPAVREQVRSGGPTAAGPAWTGAGVGAAVQSLNPDVSVIVDTFYHNDNSKEGIQHVFGELAGFGHSHAGHEHEHTHLEDGFNLRHLELHLSAEVDPYFKGWAIGAICEEGAEIEEAVIQTTCLPYGLQIQGGKFFSNFSRINAQHSHEWDFVDMPLANQLLFGDHGLNDKGVQLSWLTPAPFQVLFGLEAFQGENELAFQHHGEEPFDQAPGPRVWLGWVKVAPNLPEAHGLEFGLAGGRGVHQEEHDALDNAAWSDSATVTFGADGEADHWFDGDTTFFGADVVYKYDAPREHGAGDLTVQSGYLWRRKDLELVDHILPGAPVGEDRVDTQDGYYAQAVYGFRPRWRAGLRWEQVGLTNSSELPDGTSQSFGDSTRLSAMLDFSPSEFSRLRLQVARGEYATDDGDEEVWQVSVQWMISLGSHGAHKF